MALYRVSMQSCNAAKQCSLAMPAKSEAAASMEAGASGYLPNGLTRQLASIDEATGIDLARHVYVVGSSRVSALAGALIDGGTDRLDCCRREAVTRTNNNIDHRSTMAIHRSPTPKRFVFLVSMSSLVYDY